MVSNSPFVSKLFWANIGENANTKTNIKTLVTKYLYNVLTMMLQIATFMNAKIVKKYTKQRKKFIYNDFPSSTAAFKVSYS